MKNLKSELTQAKVDLGISDIVYCTNDEQKELSQLLEEGHSLPDGVQMDSNGDFFRIIESDITEKELDLLLKFRQTIYLRKIKNCALYFVVIPYVMFLIYLILTTLFGGIK